MQQKQKIPSVEKNWEIKDRTYVLANGKSPISWTIQTKHTARKPLLWFDEETGINREIRYATNQRSLFVDEQDGTATLAHAVFLDGVMYVPKEDQKWAMTLLTKYAFAPNAFQIPSDIYSYLQRERRGWSGTKDPNVLNMFLNMQKDLFNHLFHVNVLKRISNTQIYGNSYSVSEMMKDLQTHAFLQMQDPMFH